MTITDYIQAISSLITLAVLIYTIFIIPKLEELRRKKIIKTFKNEISFFLYFLTKKDVNITIEYNYGNSLLCFRVGQEKDNLKYKNKTPVFYFFRKILQGSITLENDNNHMINFLRNDEINKDIQRNIKDGLYDELIYNIVSGKTA